MAAAKQIPVAEYLATTYHPDRDYVDGEVLERNLGEYEHSRPQMRIGAYFYNREKEWRIRVVPEQRVQVKATRFRIPDICVVHEDSPVESIFRQPPFICIEILSKDDSFNSVIDRLDDDQAMGVENIWVIDPGSRRGYTYRDGLSLAKDGVLRAWSFRHRTSISGYFRVATRRADLRRSASVGSQSSEPSADARGCHAGVAFRKRETTAQSCAASTGFDRNACMPCLRQVSRSSSEKSAVSARIGTVS
jgi:Uma2 family endonuclease